MRCSSRIGDATPWPAPASFRSACSCGRRRNLKEIFRSGHDSARLLGVAERLVILLPEAWEERRDRGLVHAALGARYPAMVDLAGYLEHAPDAPDGPAIKQRLAELGHDDASRLH